jgi:predicted transcriptional regulator
MDSDALRKLISRTGLRYGFVASALGLSPSALSKRLAGERSWREKEAAALHRLLDRYHVKVAVSTIRRYCGLERSA